MKTTLDHNNHRHSVINYLFFGIAASIFTLSIFFSLYQQEEKVKFVKDMSFMVNSRLTKPVSATTITETYPVNLKEMMSDTEAPLVVEPWMTEPYPSSLATKAPAIPTTYTESALVVEEWMTDLDSWTTISANSTFEEEALAIESWMLNTEDWAILNANSAYRSNEFATEQLHIENWMLNLDNYLSLPASNTFEDEMLTIESWMLNTNEWAVFKHNEPLANVAEEQLYIEEWMLDLRSWSAIFNDVAFEEAPLIIESWMLNTSTWLADAK